MVPITLTKSAGRWIANFPYDRTTNAFFKEQGWRFESACKGWCTTDDSLAAIVGDGTPAGIAARIAARRAASAAEREASIAASRATDAAFDVPAPQGCSYLPYQRAGIAYAMVRKDVLIGDEMGLGKTVQALGVVNADATATRVLVICPASLKLNWARESRRWLVRQAQIHVVGATKKTAYPTLDAGDNQLHVVIVNYEIVAKHRAQIDATKWDVLIVDEAHYLKSSGAIRTKQILGHWDRDPAKLIKPIRAGRRVMLSGTPMVNRPIELWPILRSLDKNGLGADWSTYVRRYCDGKSNGYGWDVSGASNLDELQERLRASIMVRRLKVDVLTELPPKRRQIIALHPEGDGLKAIAAEKKIEAQHAAEIKKLKARQRKARASGDAEEYKAAVAALKRAQQVAFTEISRVRHETAVAKIPAVIEHVAGVLEEVSKVVVMAHHHDVIEALAAHFGDAAVSLTGETSMEARQAAVDSFQSNSNIRVFLGSIGAAGVGITLTAAAHVIFAELDWVPGRLSQAEDRCHRIGQHSNVLVQHIVIDGSIDQRMAEVVVGKQEILGQALDGAASDPVNDDDGVEGLDALLDTDAEDE